MLHAQEVFDMTVVAIPFWSLKGGFELKEVGISNQSVLPSCSSLSYVRLCFDSYSSVMPWNPL